MLTQLDLFMSFFCHNALCVRFSCVLGAVRSFSEIYCSHFLVACIGPPQFSFNWAMNGLSSLLIVAWSQVLCWHYCVAGWHSSHQGLYYVICY